MDLLKTKFLLLLLSHLAFLLASSSSGQILPPAAAPSYHHHHHHHHHHPSTTHSPTQPPVHPPVKPPVHPPVKPPTKPPVHPPVKPPTKPPVHPPVKPPVHPPVPTKSVSVQGVVNCKNCSYHNVDTLLGSTPLPGATVVLKCRTIGAVLMKNATTDKNGYFNILAPKGVVSYKATRYCHVYLAAVPAGATCTQATDINGGRKGALLKPQETLAPLPYALFTVGPFAYQPPKHRCHKTTSN